MKKQSIMKERFRGYLPVVVDVETAGVDPQKHALLEIACYFVSFNAASTLIIEQNPFHEHVEPEAGTEIDPEALLFNGIDPSHPFRFAKKEKAALQALSAMIKQKVAAQNCKRAILVGHNAWFDLHFLNAAYQRHHLKSPFHSFSSIDTASLGAVLYGQTVLRHAMLKAKLAFDEKEAHSALYDAERTAAFFCTCVNNHPI